MQDVIQYIYDAAEIITPTQRLSRHLHHRYATLQLQAGKRAWETPSVLPWAIWCNREWRDTSLMTERRPILLNGCQQQILWQQAVRQSDFAGQCLQPLATARLAMRSYRICKSAELAIFPDNVHLNDDACAFKTWAQDYEHTLAGNNWVDDANLADHIAKNLPHQAGRHIVLYGFDRHTLQQQTLIKALIAKGCRVSTATIRKQNQSVLAYAAPDNRLEISRAALWAKQKLTACPEASIGIVSLDLHSRRSHIENEFSNALAPGSLMQFEGSEVKPYTIALGKPLSDYGIVHTAMALLKLAMGRIPLSRLSTILLSPYISGRDAEQFERARFDSYLRKYGEQSLTPTTLLRLAAQQNQPHPQCKIFIKHFKAFHIHHANSPDSQSLRDWAKTFAHWLTLLGWPGDRPLNSDEHQIIQAWQAALQQLASLDQISPAVACQSALSRLSWIIADRNFQPQTAETPVQILGPTGAAGMQFDHLWVLGMHDQQWPPAAKPDPFIPLKLQTEADLPAATAKQQYQLAKQITQQLTDSAREVIYSYAEHDHDRQLRPSPLITRFLNDASRLDNANRANRDDFKTAIFKSQKLETFTDDRAPAITRENIVRGGTAIFKDQAACPFKSFAKHRLHADGLAQQNIGLDAAERGLLVHKILQHLWQRLKTSDRLRQQSQQEMDKLIRAVVAATLRQWAAKRPSTFTPRFTQLEDRRLVTLISEWLALERERPPFKVIATEQRHERRFNDIEIRMQIDRIDQSADGELLIIDYKTGAATIDDWQTERPKEPQLPLYAITTEGHIAAVVFARVKRGEMRFIGIAKDEDLIPKVKRPQEAAWMEQLQQWRQTLTVLAENFRQGRAEVDPKDPQACQYCDLHALCRIHEKTGVQI